MARCRDRPKTTIVDLMKVTVILISGVVQVGDVRDVLPYSRAINTGGPRGTASFVTFARHIHSATRLNFNDQDDAEFADENLINGEDPTI